MNISDLNALTASPLERPAAKTATFNSSSVDLQQYNEGAKVMVEVGAVTGTAPTLDGKVQDSADNVSFADVSGLAFTQVTTSNNSQSIAVDTRAVRRHIRYVGAIGGTTPSFTMAVQVIGKKKLLS